MSKDIIVPVSMTVIIETADDDTLNAIQAAAWHEVNKRITARIERGEFAPLNSSEQELVAFRNPVGAMKEYRLRTNASLFVAKVMVNNFARKLAALDFIAHAAAV